MTKHTAKKIRQGQYQYRGCLIEKRDTISFVGDICKYPWAYQMPNRDSEFDRTFSLKQAKAEIDFALQVS